MAKIATKLQNLAKKKTKKESEEELALQEQATDIVSEAEVATAQSVAPVQYAEVESIQTVTPTIVTDATVGTATVGTPALATEMPAVAAMYALSPLAVAGMGVVLSSSDDNCSTSSTPTTPLPANNKKVEGVTTAGPIIAGHQLSVELYQADGVTKLGSAKLSATGAYSIEIGTYTGVVIAKIVDADTGADFKDEATKMDKDLTAVLLATAVVGADAVTILNINPVTTIAAIEAGVKADGTGTTNAAKIADANTAVAKVFGLANVTSTTPTTTLDTNYKPEDNLSDGEKYGVILATLSGADKNNAGDMQATINKITTGLTGSTLSSDAKNDLIAGANTASANVAGDMQLELMQLIDPVAAKTATEIINKIVAYAADSTDATKAPTVEDYVKVGVAGVNADNLPTINAAVAAKTGADADSIKEIQVIVTSLASSNPAADALAKIKAFADLETPTAEQTPTVDDYKAAGLTGVDEANLPTINAAVAAKTGADVDTVAEIQAIATAADKVADALATIKAYAEDDATNTAPTVDDYTNAGVTGVTEAKLAAVNTAVAAKTGADVDTAAEIQAIVTAADALVITSAFAGETKVENFGVASNIVLTASENITAVAGKKIKIINDGGAGFHGESAVHSFEIAVDDTSMVTIAGNKITINPTFDLDLANNYHIEIDAGAFKAGTKESVVLSDATAMDFSTVTPGTASVANAVLATKMDADGKLVDAFKWLDIEGIGSPSATNPAALDVASGNIALVTKDYDPQVGNATYDGIGVNDFYIRVSNFGLGDLLYIDNQDNNINLQGSNLPAQGLPTDNDTQISFNPYGGSLGGVVEFANTLFDGYTNPDYQVISA